MRTCYHLFYNYCLIKMSDNVNTLLSSNQLKIIDLALYGKDENLKALAVEIRNAVYNEGVAILINHGISQQKIQKAWNSYDNFLQLPEEIKKKYERTPNCTTGYLPPGTEALDKEKRFELRHSFNICENFKEQMPTELYNDVYDLLQDYKTLTNILLESIALALEMPRNFFIKNHEKILNDKFENATTLRLLHYPPVAEDITDDKNFIRCGAHKDYGTFTLLSQDSEGGLEIKRPGSECWQRVGYLQGSIIMNFGEIFDLWTSNRYPAVNHRVVIPKEINIKNSSRHSIAFFVHADNETIICPDDIPLPGTESQASNEKSLTALEHVQIRLKESLGFY